MPYHLDLQSIDSKQLDRACREVGFFYLRGHGVDSNTKHSVLRLANEFFQQPNPEKQSLQRTARNSWGYNDAELTKNRRDWKEVLDIGPAVTRGPLAGSIPQWPDLEGFQHCFEQLSQQLHRVALALVAAIESALGVDEDLNAAFAEHSSFLRLNYYPPCPTPAPADTEWQSDEGELGISHHTDAGAVTVLLQDDQPGLQVWQAGCWHSLTPADDELIINIGDIVQVWSNDRYQAPLHRVLAHATSKRVSIPYFLNPSYEYDYAPLIPGSPHYRPINWGEFRSRRSAGDYADYGDEVQINDYRLPT